MDTTSIDRQHRGIGEEGECIHCGGTGYVLDVVETTLGEFEDVSYVCHMCAKDDAPGPTSPKAKPSTRHHVVDREFATLLAGDFPRLPEGVVLDALYGHPQKAAIRVCAWAETCEEPSKALRCWADKHRPTRGRPEPTDEEVEASKEIARQMMARPYRTARSAGRRA